MKTNFSFVERVNLGFRLFLCALNGDTLTHKFVFLQHTRERTDSMECASERPKLNHTLGRFHYCQRLRHKDLHLSHSPELFCSVGHLMHIRRMLLIKLLPAASSPIMLHSLFVIIIQLQHSSFVERITLTVNWRV